MEEEESLPGDGCTGSVMETLSTGTSIATKAISGSKLTNQPSTYHTFTLRYATDLLTSSTTTAVATIASLLRTATAVAADTAFHALPLTNTNFIDNNNNNNGGNQYEKLIVADDNFTQQNHLLNDYDDRLTGTTTAAAAVYNQSIETITDKYSSIIAAMTTQATAQLDKHTNGIIETITTKTIGAVTTATATIMDATANITDFSILNESTTTTAPAASQVNADDNYWALFAIVLVIGTAAGNILVCLAIAWERRLQNVTNYFLMSLAITDLMVAILVMPLGILTLYKGKWIIYILY